MPFQLRTAIPGAKNEGNDMSAHDAREQYFLELVNRARMNPAGEAAKFHITLNKDLAQGTLNATPKQVLAGNALLNNSATSHSQWMLSKDTFSHTGANGTAPWDRMQAAGYAWNNAGENIVWYGASGTLNLNSTIAVHHTNLFKSSGHRVNLLNDDFGEIGIGSVGGEFEGWNALMSTQNFGTSGAASFVTGVAYRDTVNDNFYSIGEGQAGISAELIKDGVVIGSHSTASAGGYAIKTTHSGAVEIVYSGGGLTGEIGARFILGNKNLKFDLVNNKTIETNASATLTRDAKNITLLGIESKNLTGNAADNRIEGNGGSNHLSGGGGDDTLIGRKGADSLTGGLGADNFIFCNIAEGGDNITDFAAGDQLCFASSKFAGIAKGTLSASAFQLGDAAHDNSDHFIFNASTHVLWFDSNGNAAGGMSKIATLSNGYELAPSDILLI
jgi:serralysin